ncbi:MAG: hypothetical protein JW809_19555 [Pirellulales bacterium]|nr:hypothetical protein [Pirellulales bacterium]
MRCSIRHGPWLVLVLLAGTAVRADDLGPLLATLKAVGPQGTGSKQAAGAWKQLAQAEAGELPTILSGMDGAGPLAANWIGSAADVVAQRAIDQGNLPTAAMEHYVRQTDHAPQARRLAYEWLCRVDPGAPERLLPDMLDDPSLELRRDAIARLIEAAAPLPKAEALPLLKRALGSARDLDQIQRAAGQIDKLGEKVDIARQLGCVLRWKVIGPWDNTDGKGFAAAYPPEEAGGLDFARSWPGKPDAEGKPRTVSWINHVAPRPFGEIDFNKVLVEEKSVVAYAAAELDSPREQKVQIRCGSNSALVIWVNGERVGGFEVYHAGGQFDEYTCEATLRQGRNILLVKVCQNAQTQPFARVWSLQLRICDSLGGGIPLDQGAVE